MKKNPSIYLLLLVLCFPGCQNIATYEGYVKDAKTGEPLEGVHVEIVIPKTRTLIKTETNAEGYYKISFPKTDTILTRYSCTPYQRIRECVVIPLEDCEKNNNSFKAVDILLKYEVPKNQADCRGKVIDEYGKPIKEVDVIADWGGRVDITSKRGEYVIANLKGNRVIKYYLRKKGYQTSEVISVMLDSLGTCVYAPDVVLKKK